MNLSSYLNYLNGVLEKVDEGEVDRLVDLLSSYHGTGKTVYVIGNGGSAANASHLAQDLAKGTRATTDTTIHLRAISLTDNLPFFSALGNDEGYDQVFVGQLRTFADEGDLLIAISGSGNSTNVINAVTWAKENGLTTVGVTGFDGGKLKELVDQTLHVPLNDMCTAESVHSILFHYIVLELASRFQEA